MPSVVLSNSALCMCESRRETTGISFRLFHCRYGENLLKMLAIHQPARDVHLYTEDSRMETKKRAETKRLDASFCSLFLFWSSLLSFFRPCLIRSSSGEYFSYPNALLDMVKSNTERAELMRDTVENFVFLIPRARAPEPTLHTSHPVPSDQVQIPFHRREAVALLPVTLRQSLTFLFSLLSYVSSATALQESSS